MTEFEVFKKALEREGFTITVTEYCCAGATIDLPNVELEFDFDENGKLTNITNYQTY